MPDAPDLFAAFEDYCERLADEAERARARQPPATSHYAASPGRSPCETTTPSPARWQVTTTACTGTGQAASMSSGAAPLTCWSTSESVVAVRALRCAAALHLRSGVVLASCLHL